MKFYFTRHERTPYNIGKRNGITVDGTQIVQSWIDGPDNQIMPTEKYFARKKGFYLSFEKIQLIVHSGLGRAKETAENIAEHMHKGITIEEDALIRDRSFGFWDGYSIKELETGRHKESYAAWHESRLKHNHKFKLAHSRELFLNPKWYDAATPPESLLETRERMSEAIAKYRKVKEDTLFVGHRDSTRAGIAQLVADFSPQAIDKDLYAMMDTIDVPNDALYRIDVDNKTVERYDQMKLGWVTVSLSRK